MGKAGVFGMALRCSLRSSLHIEIYQVSLLTMLRTGFKNAFVEYCTIIHPITYVNPPRPIEVKKLMENRVFRGSSLGKRPSKACCKTLQNKTEIRS
jgi:hypothetical protein